MDTNGSFTSVLVVDVAEADFAKLSGEVTELLRRKGSSIAGLIEGALLCNEARTQLWLISRWESQHVWARSRWDEDVGRIVTDLIESAATYRVESLTPISIVRGRSDAV